MRVSTAFNRLLQIPGATVTEVTIGDRDVEVFLRPRARLLACPCGKRLRAAYDRRRRRWRHLDLACRRLWLVYDIRRLDCPDCGVITEELPWARPGARHTRDFEDMVLWLAQRTDRTSVSTLMRCAWETVTAIINRQATAIIPIRKNGRPWKEDCPAAIARNETLRATRHYGRAFWKRWTGYHVRSRIEAKMRCLKAFGERIPARDPDRQTAEIQIRIALMNRFSALGTAEIVRVA